MWDMAWTASADLIERRTNEEFLKCKDGDPKVEFTIPINWIDILDIFSNFRLQEPFGLDDSPLPPEDRGEYGRYYYIESLAYDFINQKISIVGIDLQYLLRQCMIVAHCTDVAETWKAASESDKMYAYVGNCDANSFVFDGAPLKKVCECIVPTPDLCMKVAHCGDVSETWADASHFDRVYAYVGNCVANSFVSDGSPLKQVCAC